MNDKIGLLRSFVRKTKIKLKKESNQTSLEKQDQSGGLSYEVLNLLQDFRSRP